MRALLICGLAALLGPAGAAGAQDGAVPPEFEEELLLEDPFHPAPPAPQWAPDPDPGNDDAGQEDAAAPLETPDETDEAELPRIDTLFAELKKERSEERADAIAARIQAEWLRSGSPTIDLLMGWAAQAIVEENHGAAFDLLEQAMLLAPDYAEAWNARATLNFQLSHYGRSLADIEQTLRREPRHFGALMGLAAILEELGHEERALEAYLRVLDVYPAMRNAQDAAGRLADEVGGQSL